jgi:hypothetical protein
MWSLELLLETICLCSAGSVIIVGLDAEVVICFIPSSKMTQGTKSIQREREGERFPSSLNISTYRIFMIN